MQHLPHVSLHQGGEHQGALAPRHEVPNHRMGLTPGSVAGTLGRPSFVALDSQDIEELGAVGRVHGEDALLVAVLGAQTKVLGDGITHFDDLSLVRGCGIVLTELRDGVKRLVLDRR